MKKLIFLSILCSTAAVCVSRAQSSQTHELKLIPANVHWGYYDPAVKPVLRIASGDTVRVETMLARGVQRLRAAGASEQEIPNSLKAVESKVTDRGPGAHQLTGHIWIDGAQPYYTLE